MLQNIAETMAKRMLGGCPMKYSKVRLFWTGSVKSTPAHPKGFQWGLDQDSVMASLSQFEPDESLHCRPGICKCVLLPTRLFEK